MTWTYDASSSPSNKDKVRFLSGDVSSGSTGGLISDEEINWVLSEESNNVYRSAALVCESVAGKYSAEPDVKIGDLSMSGSQVQTQFIDRAKDLRRRSLMRGVSPFVGGISQATKNTQESDSDRVVPAFRVGFMDHPGTPSTRST